MCACLCACVCVRTYVCVCLRMCVRACVCVPCKSGSTFVRVCVRVYSLASQPYFHACAHARAKVGGEREGKIRLNRPSRFLWHTRNVFHVYIMTIT